MQFEGFGLTIQGGREEANGYVVMNHGEPYQVVLSNNHSLRCNAALSIDGKHIGLFRVEGRSSVMLERPLHDEGRFTFYKHDSPEGLAAALPSGESLGLVQAMFTPEHQAIPEFLRHSSSDLWPQGVVVSDDIQDEPEPSPAPSLPYEAGGTGLSGHSQQQFDNAEDIELEEEARVIISLRLVAQRTAMPRPLTSHRSTPVPPPV